MNLKDILHKDVPSNKAVIVVTGGWNAGKSTFLASVSDRNWTAVEALHTVHYYADKDDRVGYSRQEPISLDFAQITVGDNGALLLLEVPGPIRWDSILENEGLREVFVGVILVMDSARPETFLEARHILRILHTREFTPIVVAANKQDMGEAWSVEDLQIALRMEELKPPVPCVATDRKSATRVLLALLVTIPNNKLVERVTAKLHGM